MKSLYYFLLLFFALTSVENSYAQQTVGVFKHLNGSNDDGYVLFAPDASDTTYLIDKCGREVHKWGSHYRPGLDAYLLPDGTLLRSGNYPNPVFDQSGGSAGGMLERFDWNGNLIWSYLISDSLQIQNHDIYYMPNGNILLAIWEVISVPEAIANGRNPAFLDTALWSAKIIEIQPVGTNQANIVWQWRLWDHLIQDFDPTKPNYGVVADHPELVNLNYINTKAVSVTEPDWLHLNAVTYNDSLNQVMISLHNMNEIMIIDHSTNTITAALHNGGKHNKGGDLLYRWGNPAAYNRGTIYSTTLFQQHDPSWIPHGYRFANKIMVFNNGLGRFGGDYSSVDIIDPPIDSNGDYIMTPGNPYGPTNRIWGYEHPILSFFSMFQGGAQPLANGNILICDAIKGHLFEIDSSKTIVWDYIDPVDNGLPIMQDSAINKNSIYRSYFYSSSYAGFTGHLLIPQGRIELNAPDTCILHTTIPAIISSTVGKKSVIIYPNPAKDIITIQLENIEAIELIDVTGRLLINNKYNHLNSIKLPIFNVQNGICIIKINNTIYEKVIIQH